MNRTEYGKAIGQPVDLSPWAYVWRRDLEVQTIGEAYFIPRRLERIDKVYRTALDELGESIKSYYYRQDDLLSPLLPKPEFPLLTGLLWVGGITEYYVELKWDDAPPAVKDIEVRTYPTAWGWFGWTVDKILSDPEISGDGRVWKYTVPSGQTMDFAYSTRTPAATQMVAVFAGEGIPVPAVSVCGDSLGVWEELAFSVKWDDGVLPAGKKPDYSGHIAYVDMTGFDPEQNRADFVCLFSRTGRFGNDSKFTFITDAESDTGATVLLRELADEVIRIPEIGITLFREGADPEPVLPRPLSIREEVRRYAEPTSFDEIMYNTRLCRCPDATVDFPDAPASDVYISVPDRAINAAYRTAVEQLRGHHMWGNLAAEVGRVTYDMELNGLHKEADKVYDYFLASPGIKSDGDFSDASGSFEWAKSMRHDMGYSHEGTHASTGLMLFSMMTRYFITGDRDWLNARLPRLKAAGEWIDRERTGYMSHIPNRDSLFVAGLMPPMMSGDYALPACDWHWGYCDNAWSYLGLSRLAQALVETGDPDAAKFTAASESFREELLRVVHREALYAPVRRESDGQYRTFLSMSAYFGGLLNYGEETNVPNFSMGSINLFEGALPLSAFPGAPLDPRDRIMVGTVDAMEQLGAEMPLVKLKKLDHPTADMSKYEGNKNKEKTEDKAETADVGTDFNYWSVFSNLPKHANNCNVYMRQDDVPNYLRFFFNHAALMFGSNGKLWEHAHTDSFDSCTDPDNGTSGWFVENIRNMLVMEDEDCLWVMRAIPRAWLAQGCRTEVGDAPTFFGKLGYTVTSDIDNGRVECHFDLNARKLPETVKFRFRHPDSKCIRKVILKVADASVSGKVDPDGETVILSGITGDVSIILTVLY